MITFESLLTQLPVRTENCLRAEEITSISQLLSYDDYSLMKIPNLGKKSIAELKEVLSKNGLFVPDKEARADHIRAERITLMMENMALHEAQWWFIQNIASEPQITKELVFEYLRHRRAGNVITPSVMAIPK